MYDWCNEELLNTVSLVRSSNFWCTRSLVNREVEGLRESIETRTHRLKHILYVMRECYSRLLDERRMGIG
jgi:hypothetical protein